MTKLPEALLLCMLVHAQFLYMQLVPSTLKLIRVKLRAYTHF